MTTVTVKTIVHLSSFSSTGRPLYAVYNSDMSEFGHAPIGDYEFEFELPAGFNPNAARVTILEKERDRINAEFGKRVKQINEQITKLQAIEFVSEV